MIPESIAISDNYLLHEQGVTASAVVPPCGSTSADDIEIFQRTLAGNWGTLIISLSWLD